MTIREYSLHLIQAIENVIERGTEEQKTIHYYRQKLLAQGIVPNMYAGQPKQNYENTTVATYYLAGQLLDFIEKYPVIPFQKILPQLQEHTVNSDEEFFVLPSSAITGNIATWIATRRLCALLRDMFGDIKI